MARTSSFIQARNSVGAGDGSDVLARIAGLESPAHRALGRRAKLIVKRCALATPVCDRAYAQFGGAAGR